MGPFSRDGDELVLERRDNASVHVSSRAGSQRPCGYGQRPVATPNKRACDFVHLPKLWGQ